MRYVILRDDDTNAVTPPSCLERLYRPFLDRGLPVNLATIPEVNLHTRMADGTLEGYLFARDGASADVLPLASNRELVSYLRDNPGYHVVQHGCHHDSLEFDRLDRQEASRRLERGSELLMEAGFPRPRTFVAPYDKLSRATFTEAVKRFHVVSTGWFESRRLPYLWWPRFALKKLRHAEHWQVHGATLLSHPGCLLSRNRPRDQILGLLRDAVAARPLTVLVTHWWEYFQDGAADEAFIEVLHEAAVYLAGEPDLKVITFADLAAHRKTITF